MATRKAPDIAIEVLALDSLFIPSDYQRAFDERRAQRYADAFDEDVAGVWSVTARPDGEYAVTDGQHRLFAARANGYTHWPCQVMGARDVSDEAGVFVQTNRDRKALNTLDKWRARRVQGDPDVLAVEDVLQDLGLRATDHGGKSREGAVRAVNALEYAYVTGGPDHLRKVISIIQRAWPMTPAALGQRTIIGVSSFLMYYHYTNRDIDIMDLVSKMGRVPYRAFLQRAQEISGTRGGLTTDRSAGLSRDPGGMLAVLELYNHRRTTRRLPPPTLTGWRKVNSAQAAAKAR